MQEGFTAAEVRCACCNALIAPHVAAALVLAKEALLCTSTKTCAKRAAAQVETAKKTKLKLAQQPGVMKYLAAEKAEKARYEAWRHAVARHEQHQKDLKAQERERKNRLGAAREAELNRIDNERRGYPLPF